jgi:hypothetical protein
LPLNSEPQRFENPDNAGLCVGIAPNRYLGCDKSDRLFGDLVQHRLLVRGCAPIQNETACSFKTSMPHRGDLLSLDQHFSPAVVVLVYSYAFATDYPFKKPCRDDFCGWIFKTFNVIENFMIDFFNQRQNVGIDFSKVPHEAARIKGPPYDDFDAVIVAMHVFAFVAIRNQWKMMRRFEAVRTANAVL